MRRKQLKTKRVVKVLAKRSAIGRVRIRRAVRQVLRKAA